MSLTIPVIPSKRGDSIASFLTPPHDLILDMTDDAPEKNRQNSALSTTTDSFSVFSEGKRALVDWTTTAQREVRKVHASLVGKPETYWVPRDGLEHGLLETLHIKSNGKSWVAATVPVGTRPAKELENNFTLHTDQRINLNHDFFKTTRLQYALHQLGHTLSCINSDAGSNSDADRTRSVTIRGEVLKSELREQLPSLLQPEYLVVRYRDYSSYARKRLPAKMLRRDTILPGCQYIVWGFALRVGHELGTLIPLTELQYIHACEKIQAISCQSQNRGELSQESSKSIIFLTEEQFRSALAIAQSVHVSSMNYTPEGIPITSNDASENQNENTVWTFLLRPWCWASELRSYRDRQYKRLGQVLARTATLCLVGFSLYIGLYGYRAARSVGSLLIPGARSQMNVSNPTASQAPLLTAAQNLWSNGYDIRNVLDYLLAPR